MIKITGMPNCYQQKQQGSVWSEFNFKDLFSVAGKMESNNTPACWQLNGSQIWQ